MLNRNGKKSGHKRYAILLVALLLVGVATYGTYAYFTDSKATDNTLTLNKGTVTLDDFTNPDWTYKGNTGEKDTNYKADTLAYTNPNISLNTTSANFSNVLPGDTFKKELTVTYNGTADADAKITLEQTVPNGIDYSFTVTHGSDTTPLSTSTTTLPKVLKENDILTFNLLIHVPYGAESFNNSTDNFLANVTNAITVTATQHLDKNNN